MVISKRFIALVCCFVGEWATSAFANPNLIANPNFEGTTYTFNTGVITENLPTGWTLGPPASATDSDVNVTNATGGALGPQNGSNYLRYQATSNYLSGGGEDCVYQDFSTVIGAKYTLTYWIANTGTNTGNIDFRSVWGEENFSTEDAQVYSVPASPSAYQQLTFTETANSTLTRLDFHGEDPSGSILLDNVSVTAVPEPAAITLGLGLLPLLCRRARRNYMPDAISPTA